MRATSDPKGGRWHSNPKTDAWRKVGKIGWVLGRAFPFVFSLISLPSHHAACLQRALLGLC